MKVMNDYNKEIRIKIAPVIKFIPDTKTYLVLFYTHKEKIQIQDHTRCSLISSMKLGENTMPTLIGIIDKRGIRLDQKYTGEARYLTKYMTKLNSKMHTLKVGNKDSLSFSNSSSEGRAEGLI